MSASLFEAWVKCPVANPSARVRLFCLPYAGGGASIFRDWGHLLPARVEVCPIQLPGREARVSEPPFTSMVELTEAICGALHPFLDRPFAFFGHSMGALVGFECVRYLCREHLPIPVLLCISAHRAPQLRQSGEPLHTRSDKQLLDAVRRIKGTPDAVLAHSELMHLLLPTLRADFAVVETYHYVSTAPLPCAISAFGGLRDDISRTELAAWGEQTRGRFALHMLPGDHFFIHSARAALLTYLAHDLVQASN